MRKLTLDFDALRVESFDPDAGPQQHGTVWANQVSASVLNPSCCQGTCYDSCGNNCGSWYCVTDYDSCGQYGCGDSVAATCSPCEVSVHDTCWNTCIC